MRRKKSLIITICTVLGVLLLIAAGAFALRALLPSLYYRMYLGDRITGTVTVSVDGEPYALQYRSVSADQSNPIGGIPRIRLNGDGSARIMLRAGEYGGYGFLLTVDSVEAPLHICAYQYNWWNVVRFDLHVSVDIAAQTVTLESSAQTLRDNGKWRTETVCETFSLSDPEIGFAVVWI